jgi:hypothetical protein
MSYVLKPRSSRWRVVWEVGHREVGWCLQTHSTCPETRLFAQVKVSHWKSVNSSGFPLLICVPVH